MFYYGISNLIRNGRQTRTSQIGWLSTLWLPGLFVPSHVFPFCLFFLLLDEGTGFVLVYYQAGRRRRRRSSVRTKTVRTFVDAKKGIDKVQLYVFTRAFLFSIQYFLPLAHFDEMCLTLSWDAVLSTCNSC